jgi:hypothetical protein
LPRTPRRGVDDRHRHRPERLPIAVDLTSAHAEMPLPVGESFGIARAGHAFFEFPPFGRVIAKPELYHEKRISPVGYMNLQFEGNAIYYTEEEYRHGQSADAIWIEVEGRCST